jgi:hypothetical protein
MSLRTYVRVSSVAVIATAIAVLAGPAVADAMRPTSGDVTVEFDSCGKASLDFDGARWIEYIGHRPELAGRRLRGHVTTDGPSATVTVVGPGTANHRIVVRRGGFTTLVACI